MTARKTAKKVVDVGPRCEFCKHWKEAQEIASDARMGFCRRYPPVGHYEVDPMSEEGDTVLTAIWPPTASDEVCGEFTGSQ